MGTWEINFILPDRKETEFFFPQVFKCNYTADTPLFVKDETITSLEEKRMGGRDSRRYPVGRPFGQQAVDIGGTSQSGCRGNLRIDFAEVRKWTQRCTSQIKMAKA